MISFSESAQAHLATLLAEQNEDGLGIRVFVNNPGTPRAEVGFSFCLPGENDDDDIVIAYYAFKVFVEKDSAPFLEDSSVDYKADGGDGQLTIKAPNVQPVRTAPEGAMAQRVTEVLDNEVNPALAGHGGWVKLADIIDDDIAVLEFGGGCVGCAMSFMTMKQGVERTLKERIPELKEVRDATDHSDTSNAYYR